MKTRTFHCFNDPGHGWVKVALKDIVTLGLKDKISGHSYVRGEYAYLEEDCDASLLLHALKAHEVKVSFREHHSNKSSRIRNYLGYSPIRIDWSACRSLF